MSLDLFLLGGSGSSGTSLLGSVFDGLANLRSGPEVGVLDHRPLFTPDAASRGPRASTGPSAGWSRRPRANRVLEHLGRAPLDPPAFDAHRARQLGRVDERMQGGAKPTWTSHPDQPITAAAVGRWREELTGERLQAALAFSFVPPGEGPTTTFGRLLAELNYT